MGALLDAHCFTREDTGGMPEAFCKSQQGPVGDAGRRETLDGCCSLARQWFQTSSSC